MSPWIQTPAPSKTKKEKRKERKKDLSCDKHCIFKFNGENWVNGDKD
jgi:hypothetical protein